MKLYQLLMKIKLCNILVLRPDCKIKNAHEVATPFVAYDESWPEPFFAFALYLLCNLLTSDYCTFLDTLSAACSSLFLLSSDSGVTTLTAVSGDDDEVTTSAGKKRKHWIKHNVKK